MEYLQHGRSFKKLYTHTQKLYTHANTSVIYIEIYIYIYIYNAYLCSLPLLTMRVYVPHMDSPIYVHSYSGAQSCLTLCDPMDCSLPVSCIYELSQSRLLEWVVISFSRGSSSLSDWTHLSSVCSTAEFSLPLGYLGSPAPYGKRSILKLWVWFLLNVYDFCMIKKSLSQTVVHWAPYLHETAEFKL